MDIMTTTKINKQIKQQKDFSLIELSMAIAVIALLLIAVNFAFNSVRQNLRVDEAVKVLEFHMVSAVQQCMNRRGNLTGCDYDAIFASTPIVDRASPWGTANALTVATPAAAGNALVVTYNFTDSGDAAGLVADMVVKMGALPGVATAGGANGVVVTYNEP